VSDINGLKMSFGGTILTIKAPGEPFRETVAQQESHANEAEQHILVKSKLE